MEYKKGDIVIRTAKRGSGAIAEIVRFDDERGYIENFRLATKLEKLLNGL
jgi:hypothetical protein